MKEIWKDISDFNGIYQVSNAGRIKLLPRRINNKWGTDTIRKEMIMRQNKKKTCYLHISLRKGSIDKTFSVHRLVAKSFIDNPKNKPTINHKNGVKTDNRVANLEWATNSENVIHSFTTGLKIAPFGSSHYRTKFTDQIIIQIKNKHRSGGVTMKSIAIENNVSLSAISNIINGKRWTHLKSA